MRLTVLFDREEDGRWIAEVPQLPGVLVYGDTREAALRRAKALALETIAGLAELGQADIDDAIHFDAAWIAPVWRLVVRSPLWCGPMAGGARGPYEMLVTEAVRARLGELDLEPRTEPLRAAEAPDCIALHIGRELQSIR